MESLIYILSGLTTALGGLNIAQFFNFKIQKRKLNAEAQQQQNQADAGVFENFEKEIKFWNERLESLRKELTTQSDQHKVTLLEHDRKLKGIQKLLKREIGRKHYAETNICLVQDCPNRKPERGEFYTDDPTLELEEEETTV